MSGKFHGMLIGAAAGAAGTTALNTTTYLDMVVRARGASSTPEKTVTKLADAVNVTIPGDDQQRQNRVAGLGPMTGIIVGVGVGAVLGFARGAGLRPGLLVTGLAASALAMAGSAGPMTALGVTNPLTWSTKSWLADALPHLAYGMATAAVLFGAERR